MNRTTAEARCQSRHHLVARLSVNDAAHRIVEIPRVSARDIRGGKVGTSVNYGGMTVDLDDESDPYRWGSIAIGCACGLDYMFSPMNLVNLTRPTDTKIRVLMMRSRTGDGVSR